MRTIKLVKQLSEYYKFVVKGHGLTEGQLVEMANMGNLGMMDFEKADTILVTISSVISVGEGSRSGKWFQMSAYVGNGYNMCYFEGMTEYDGREKWETHFVPEIKSKEISCFPSKEEALAMAIEFAKEVL